MTRHKAVSVEVPWLAVGLSAGLVVAAIAAAWPALADDAPVPGQSENAANSDPLEPVNRVTSEFNRVVRGAVIDPLVDGYQYVTPTPVQEGVANFFSNLSEPVTVVSSILQGDGENAENASRRFLINTTIGFGGLSDEATSMGYEQRREDLGQAFGANGVEAGPHIVLPILGPSNFRDLTGDVLTGLATPVPLAAQVAGGTVEYSNNQDTVRSIGTGAVDPYVAEREAFEQNRDYLVTNGAAPDTDFPSFAAEPGADLATKPQ